MEASQKGLKLNGKTEEEIKEKLGKHPKRDWKVVVFHISNASSPEASQKGLKVYLLVM